MQHAAAPSRRRAAILSPDGLVKTQVCERYNEIAMYTELNATISLANNPFSWRGSSNGDFA